MKTFMNTKINSLLSGAAPVRVVRQFTPVLAFCGAMGLLAGCASQPETHTVYSPPPPAPTRSVTTTTTTTTPDTVPGALAGNPANVIVTTTAPGASTRYVNVTQAPPALQSDVVLAQPSPADVWIAGYWTWRDPGYRWVPGHWEIPPRSDAVWVAPVIQPQGNGYRFTEGYWN
jgi:hypothetical protein